MISAATLPNLAVPSGKAVLRGEKAGSGTPVVFLPAGVADRRIWRPQLSALQDDFHVVAYDRRGFGDTAHADETYSHAGDLRAVLDHLAFPQAVLVGGSQGGRVALEFTLAHPDRVRALVLVAPALTGAPPPAEFPAEVEARLEKLEAAEESGDVDRVNALEAHVWLDGPTAPEGRVGGPVRDLFLDMNGRALRATPLGQEAPTEPLWPRLNEIRVPTLLVWGDLDLPHVPGRCAHLLATMRDARAYEMAGTAHLPNLERPETFTAALRDFLTTLS